MSETLSNLFSSNGIFAIVGGILGGIVTQIINNKQKITELQHDDATNIRHELKARVDEVTARCDKLQVSNSEWQEKYYTLLNRVSALEFQNKALTSQLNDVLERSGIDEKLYK